jgi:4-amino-4-deoxy-L-arabinose transferase-like glycosyltransferase
MPPALLDRHRRSGAERTATLALTASIVAALAFGAFARPVTLPDSSTYLAPALSWAQGQGLMEAPGQPLQYRLPLYPLALGIVIRLFGESLRAMTLVNVAFHIAAMLLARALVARRDPAVASWAAALAIVHPPFLTATATVLQESMLSLLLVLFAWSLTCAGESTRNRAAAGAGAALGAAALGKVLVLPLALPAAILLAFVPRRSPSRAAAFLVGLLLVLVPWAIRNRVAFGRFEVTNNNGGHTLLGGTTANDIDDWYHFAEYVQAVERWKADAHRQEPVLDRYLYAVAVERIRADPGRWLSLVAGRVVRFMLPARHWMVAVGWARPGTLSPWFVAGAILQGALFVAAALLVVTVRRRRLPVTLLIGPAIVFWHLAVYAVAYVSPRYNVTIGPVLVSSAALFLTTMRR